MIISESQCPVCGRGRIHSSAARKEDDTEYLMPNANQDRVFVFIGEGAQKVAAAIRIDYYPAIVNHSMVEDVLALASKRIGDLVAKALNAKQDD